MQPGQDVCAVELDRRGGVVLSEAHKRRRARVKDGLDRADVGGRVGACRPARNDLVERGYLSRTLDVDRIAAEEPDQDRG